ncbi:MAG: hypothetical protein DI536_25710 [Archangium gephyra]|uniref:Uncharacterized protein n=1 Tax=Archangium gephyra TaxID=48 RepID=A0A2W5T6X0_9BACT|nr:MAG: hypothetical protein DI536_25710 [Archangium gephyra]
MRRPAIDEVSLSARNEVASSSRCGSFTNASERERNSAPDTMTPRRPVRIENHDCVAATRVLNAASSTERTRSSLKRSSCE